MRFLVASSIAVAGLTAVAASPTVKVPNATPSDYNAFSSSHNAQQPHVLFRRGNTPAKAKADDIFADTLEHEFDVTLSAAIDKEPLAEQQNQLQNMIHQLRSSAERFQAQERRIEREINDISKNIQKEYKITINDLLGGEKEFRKAFTEFLVKEREHRLEEQERVDELPEDERPAAQKAMEDAIAKDSAEIMTTKAILRQSTSVELTERLLHQEVQEAEELGDGILHYIKGVHTTELNRLRQQVALRLSKTTLPKPANISTPQNQKLKALVDDIREWATASQNIGQNVLEMEEPKIYGFIRNCSVVCQNAFIDRMKIENDAIVKLREDKDFEKDRIVDEGLARNWTEDEEIATMALFRSPDNPWLINYLSNMDKKKVEWDQTMNKQIAAAKAERNANIELTLKNIKQFLRDFRKQQQIQLKQKIQQLQAYLEDGK